MNMRLAFLLTLVCLGASPAFADTLRCGSKIVDTGMSMADVKKYCGQPSSTSVEEHDVRSGNRVVGTTQFHIWRYNRMSGQSTAVLEFDQDKLMSIKYVSK
jgi:hypothetical protein